MSAFRKNSYSSKVSSSVMTFSDSDEEEEWTTMPVPPRRYPWETTVTNKGSRDTSPSPSSSPSPPQSPRYQQGDQPDGYFSNAVTVNSQEQSVVTVEPVTVSRSCSDHSTGLNSSSSHVEFPDLKTNDDNSPQPSMTNMDQSRSEYFKGQAKPTCPRPESPRPRLEDNKASATSGNMQAHVITVTINANSGDQAPSQELENCQLEETSTIRGSSQGQAASAAPEKSQSEIPSTGTENSGEQKPSPPVLGTSQNFGTGTTTTVTDSPIVTSRRSSENVVTLGTKVVYTNEFLKPESSGSKHVAGTVKWLEEIDGTTLVGMEFDEYVPHFNNLNYNVEISKHLKMRSTTFENFVHGVILEKKEALNSKFLKFLYGDGDDGAVGDGAPPLGKASAASGNLQAQVITVTVAVSGNSDHSDDQALSQELENCQLEETSTNLGNSQGQAASAAPEKSQSDLPSTVFVPSEDQALSQVPSTILGSIQGETTSGDYSKLQSEQTSTGTENSGEQKQSPLIHGTSQSFDTGTQTTTESSIKTSRRSSENELTLGTKVVYTNTNEFLKPESSGSKYVAGTVKWLEEIDGSTFIGIEFNEYVPHYNNLNYNAEISKHLKERSTTFENFESSITCKGHGVILEKKEALNSNYLKFLYGDGDDGAVGDSTPPLGTKEELQDKPLQVAPPINWKSFTQQLLIAMSVGNSRWKLGHCTNIPTPIFGIQGAQNSSYLDATLFTIFAFTNRFDSSFLQAVNLLKISIPEQIRKIRDNARVQLFNRIVNPLRQTYFCSCLDTRIFMQILAPFNHQVLGHFMGIENFINLLFQQVFQPKAFLTYSNGTCEFVHQLKFNAMNPKIWDGTIMRTQRMLELSLRNSNYAKFKDIPQPALILSIPRTTTLPNQNFLIVPDLCIDIRNMTLNSYRTCIICGDKAAQECVECYDMRDPSGGQRWTSFCVICFKRYHSHPQRLNHGTPHELMTDCNDPSPSYEMKLSAIICYKDFHYVAFVKTGEEPECPWIYYDSQPGDQLIPRVILINDFEGWLKRMDALEDHQIVQETKWTYQQDMRRLLLEDSRICFYIN